mmetsp:Transcript_54153/g.116966  ORF Transcript_54153/g.116966 Transcript_54153/m.116966 type:complete len:221 (+) Transcript_54153:922-1584(+)
MLSHLRSALLNRPFIVEISPVTNKEVQRLERLRPPNSPAKGFVASSGMLHRCLREVHEVRKILNLILLNLHGVVIDLLRGEHSCEAKDGGGLLLGHVTVPSSLCIHEEQGHRHAVDSPQEGLRPEPDALCTSVHAPLETEAACSACCSTSTLYLVACGEEPLGKRAPLAEASRRRISGLMGVHPSCKALILVVEIAEEEIQEKGLARAKCTHHRNHRNAA